jgi:hypothetical protein
MAVLAWWRQKAGVRGLIGFLAGQIVVLQFLFAGIVATEMAVRASDDVFAICHTDNQTSPGEPGKTDGHVHHAACVICAFAAHASPVPADASHVAIPDGLTGIVAVVTPPAIATPENRSPRTSQGPPLSA